MIDSYIELTLLTQHEDLSAITLILACFLLIEKICNYFESFTAAALSEHQTNHKKHINLRL